MKLMNEMPGKNDDVNALVDQNAFKCVENGYTTLWLKMTSDQNCNLS